MKEQTQEEAENLLRNMDFDKELLKCVRKATNEISLARTIALEGSLWSRVFYDVNGNKIEMRGNNYKDKLDLNVSGFVFSVEPIDKWSKQILLEELK